MENDAPDARTPVELVYDYLWEAKVWRLDRPDTKIRQPSDEVAEVIGGGRWTASMLADRLWSALRQVAEDDRYHGRFYKSRDLDAEDIVRLGQVTWFLLAPPDVAVAERGRPATPGAIPPEDVRGFADRWSGPQKMSGGGVSRKAGRTDDHAIRLWVGTRGGSLRDVLKILIRCVAEVLVAQAAESGAAASARPMVLGSEEETRPVAPAPLSVGSEDALGDVLLDSSILDYRGVSLESVVMMDAGRLEDWPGQPAVVEEAKTAVALPEPNRPKAHLVGWQPPVQDQGNVLRLEVARSDYLTSLATQASLDSLQRLVTDGHTTLDDLPRRLDVHLVVIAGRDDHVLLTRRGRYVATEPSTWMVTVGESIDWLQDGVDGVPHPRRTALRCLTDFDELNLPESALDGTSLRVVGVATEWNEMLVNLLVVAEVPQLDVATARASFRKGENLAVDSLPFTVEACSPLIESGRHSTGGAAASSRVSDISRMALRAALRHRYGVAAEG